MESRDWSSDVCSSDLSLLGIGNALMQTSLNPLLSNIVSGERLASSLTFGQFVKAIASFPVSYTHLDVYKRQA